MARVSRATSPRSVHRKAGLPLVVASVVFLTAGCGLTAGSSSSGGGGAAATSGGGKAVRVVMVPAASKIPFYETVFAGMKEEAAKQNVTVEYQAGDQFASESQTKVLNAVLVTKPDVLVVAPVDAAGMRPVIQKFLDAGTKVILVDLDLTNTTGLTSRILGDNEQGGKVAADGFLKLIGDKKGSIAVMNIAPGFPTLDARVKGFTDTVNAAGKSVTVLPQESGGGDPASAQTKMRSILLAHPDLVGFFGTVETNAEGAAVAIKAANKSSDIPIVAFDLTQTEVNLVKDGTISYLSVQDPRMEGSTAVKYARAAMDGNTSSIKPLVVVNAVGVDKSNVDSPDIVARYYNGTVN